MLATDLNFENNWGQTNTYVGLHLVNLPLLKWLTHYKHKMKISSWFCNQSHREHPKTHPKRF